MSEPPGGDATRPDPYAPLASKLAWAEPIQNVVLGRPRRHMVCLLREQGCRRVLDVCCGGGWLVHRLARAGLDAVGVDSSPTMLALARRRPRGATFLQRDAARLPYVAEFDAATIALSLHAMAPQVRVETWQAMRRAVHPGGLLVALDYDPPGAGWLSRRVGRFVDADERGSLRFDPAHYENYLQFMAGGGLTGWPAALGAEPVLAHRHLWGNLLIGAVRNGPPA